MKIPLTFADDYNAVNANAVVKILIDKRPEFPISFILDTGCPFTFISVPLLQYWAISQYVKVKKYKTLSWGSKRIKLLLLGKAELVMFDANKRIVSLKAKTLFLARLNQIPESIMGINFLRSSGVKLILDAKNNRAHFEK